MDGHTFMRDDRVRRITDGRLGAVHDIDGPYLRVDWDDDTARAERGWEHHTQVELITGDG